MKSKAFIISCILILCGTIVFAQTFGVKKRMKRPKEYGNVIINNYSGKKNIAPVVFKHWLHRAKYTCRLCHVDLGFAMETGGTDILEEDIRTGMYCGACHNGKDVFGHAENVIGGKMKKNCDRCHSYGKNVDFKYKFREFVKGFPRSRFGNKVDWLKAEELGLVKLKDYIEGISIKRKPLRVPKDIELEAKVTDMPNIIFSHKKHTVWNGCELCHPDIFGVKKGSTPYSMQDIFEGRFCGACHGKVAFTNHDCQLCHTKDVY